MVNLFAQTQSPFWSQPNGSTTLWIYILAALVLGIGIMLLMLAVPVRARRPIVAGFTFIAGLYYVLFYFWPMPIGDTDKKLSVNFVDHVGMWLSDTMPVVSSFTNTLAGFLLGLGIYSLLRVHGRRVFRQQKDWAFSAVLILSAVAMIAVGFMDWHSRKGPDAAKLNDPANWHAINYAKDFLFDGQFQGMDAAMFSIIAFYILSAAYRAFRIRSVEATVLLSSALIVILSLMGAVEYLTHQPINALTHGDQNAFLQNFSLISIRNWLQAYVQTPSIRGIDFGVGIGTVAMGLRLWLSLEKSGSS
jgi:hypothetical protein